MAQEFLDCADIIVGFEQMRGERVAEGVGCNMFIDYRCLRRAPDGFLETAFIGVMATYRIAPWINGESVGGKNILLY